MRDWAMAWYGFAPMPMSHGGHGGQMPDLPNTGGGSASQTMALPTATLALFVGLAALLAGAPLRRSARDAR